MKLLFTKLQEEITTVKKSITQFRVETGSDSKTPEFPDIELNPESPKIVHREVVRSPRASFDERRVPLALSAKAGQVADVVDLHGVAKDAHSPITYSAAGALKARPYPIGLEGEESFKTEDNLSTDRVSLYHNPDEIEIFSTLDEKRARYQFTTRKFIATQEMIEFHKSREKRISFELTI